MKVEIDYTGLTKFLKSLKLKDFEQYNNKVCKIEQGYSVNEIELHKMDKTMIRYSQVINNNDYFLVDALGNDLSIIILTRKKYKLPSGRVILGKFHKTIISDCREQYGSPLNGYWKIPDKFLIKKEELI